MCSFSSALSNATAQPMVSPNPFCPIQLILQDSSVHSHFRSRLSSQFTAPDLTSYLKQRNDWTDAILPTINWAAHSTSLHKFPISHRPFLCKLIHRHLPLGKRLASWSSDHPSCCPSCGYPTEDHDHFLTCPARLPWVEERLTKLDEQLTRAHTYPGLQIILMRQLRHILLGQPLPFPPSDPRETELYDEQSAIGWHQILYGRFSNKWSNIQSRHKPRYSAGWQSTTICAIWTLLQELWFLRNNHLHVNSPASLDPIRDRLLHASVTELFDLQPALTALDQHLFPAPLTQTLAFPRSTLSTWLNLANPAVDAALASLPLDPPHLPILPPLSPNSPP